MPEMELAFCLSPCLVLSLVGTVAPETHSLKDEKEKGVFRSTIEQINLASTNHINVSLVLLTFGVSDSPQLRLLLC